MENYLSSHDAIEPNKRSAVRRMQFTHFYHILYKLQIYNISPVKLAQNEPNNGDINKQSFRYKVRNC